MGVTSLIALAAITAAASGTVAPSPTAAISISGDEQTEAMARKIAAKLDWLYSTIGRERREWLKKARHRSWSMVQDGDGVVFWFVEFDGVVVPEDDAARARPMYPSAFLALLYDRGRHILGLARQPDARAEDSLTQDDLLFDERGRTIGHRRSYLTYIDCGAL